MQTQKVLFVLVIIAGMTLAGCAGIGPLQETPNMSLEDTGWLLEDLHDKAPISGTQVTINFDKDTVYGSDGCNNYSGSYNVEGSKITFGENMAVTMMACEESIMGQASDYITTLMQASAYKINEQQLTLQNLEGTALVTFTKSLK